MSQLVAQTGTTKGDAVILPLGFFIALIWFLVWFTFACLEDDENSFFISVFGAGAIIFASIAIHLSWPVSQVVAEAVK